MPASRLTDPRLPASYLYQLCPLPLGNLAPDTPNRTWRDWKRRQLKLAGKLVPIVRCLQHDPVLNLGLDGSTYESPIFWEMLVTNHVSLDELSPARLFAHEPPPDPVFESPPPQPPAPVAFQPKSPLRIVVWRLDPAPTNAALPIRSNTLPIHLQQAADALRPMKADVIVLLQARDWSQCDQLAQALKPANFQVAACSAFPGARANSPTPPQTAILSRYPVGFSWSQGWRTPGQTPGRTAIPGGYALAVLKAAAQNIGVFSVELSDPMAQAYLQATNTALVQAQSACIQQWLSEVESFRNWTSNRLDAVVVAGAFAPGVAATNRLKLNRYSQSLLAAPFEHSLSPPEATNGVGASSFTVRLPEQSGGFEAVVLSQCPITCELELPALQLATNSVVASSSHGEQPPPTEPPTTAPAPAHGAPPAAHPEPAPAHAKSPDEHPSAPVGVASAEAPPHAVAHEPGPAPASGHSASSSPVASHSTAPPAPHAQEAVPKAPQVPAESAHGSVVSNASGKTIASAAKWLPKRRAGWWGLGSAAALALAAGGVWSWRRRRAKSKAPIAAPAAPAPPSTSTQAPTPTPAPALTLTLTMEDSPVPAPVAESAPAPAPAGEAAPKPASDPAPVPAAAPVSTQPPFPAPTPVQEPSSTPVPVLGSAPTPIPAPAPESGAAPVPAPAPIAIAAAAAALAPTPTPVKPAEPTVTPVVTPITAPIAAPAPSPGPTSAVEPPPTRPPPVEEPPATEPDPDLSQILQEAPTPEQELEQRLTDLTIQIAMAQDDKQRDALQSQMSQVMAEMEALRAQGG